ncbi:flagellar hook-associated protein FlgK [Pontibacillus yanchengensis]|uniref:Flagellar hook-associated protein 1 n=1 Tax=Pontibacillus yanchengensis Y32 TaxID=1385514 RepID=A0A0A2TDC0_9BACI|nr:flagellar hook-associated protein FlgK [Pontibacillus yanchengensis]KGP73559.1 flagellar hook protein FlgK [Pontibacillus yanchengensis Y32]
MTSTFHGLEVAKRGMFAQQSALYTTGHNISNANTDGYSRQRVNFEQTAPYPPASRNRPEIPGQMGSGVQAGTIERVREGFLDAQFRGENHKAGYYTAKSDALGKMEEVMNEPSDQGLSKTMDRFWQSLQDLSAQPEDSGVRSQVKQRGKAVADTFNYLSDSLNGIKQDFKNQIDVAEKDINSLARQINNLNNQISEVEPHGYLPNDLYDERDRLIDELSTQANIKVSYEESSSSALAQAQGKATVEIVDGSGNSLFSNGGNSVPLVDGSSNTYNQISVQDTDSNGGMDTVALGGTATVDAKDFQSVGKMMGLIDSYGYDDGGSVKGTYPEMLNELDGMAHTFATEFNNVQNNGVSLNEIEDASEDNVDFFTQQGSQAGYAGSMEVNIDDINDIAAAKGDPTTANAGDGDNAIALGDVSSTTLDYNGTDASFQSYYEGVIGEMAIQSQEATRLQNNSETLRQSVEERRQSVSGVSLDEEMSNMIKFQHAYNAAARNLTTVDEMLDKIINGMGRVGR